jgi:hypothetical protein
MSACPICGRDAQDKFCAYHKTASDNLNEMYNEWEKAAGLTWEEYLEKISEIEDTGRWVREIIEYITQQNGL